MIRIEYDNNLFIEINDSSRVFFYGSNQQMKQNLIRSLKRFATGRVLSELEEIIYGENGIEIYRDDKRLSSKDITLLLVQDNLSIYKEIDFLKGSLMQRFLQEIGQDVEIESKIARMNDELLSIEIEINEKLSKISDNISSNLTALTYEILLKNQLFLSYFAENHDFPLEMMDANELIDEFVNLLQSKIASENREVWLVLINPESFLISERVQYLLEKCVNIDLLKTLIISYQPLEIEYQAEDIANTVILSEEIYSLPEFEDFFESLKRHYPDEIKLSEDELVKSFFEISCKVGKSSMNIGLSNRNLLLLKVINDILGIESSSFSVKFDELTPLEKSFLTHEN